MSDNPSFSTGGNARYVGALWLTSTDNDKNGGTPTVLDNVIVRLTFP